MGANGSSLKRLSNASLNLDPVVSNDLILQSIFQHLNLKDLKACRLVNKIWHKESTKFLLKLNNLKPITITCAGNTQMRAKICTYSEGRDLNPSPNPEIIKSSKLKSLQKIIETSNSFPITNFHVITTRWNNEELTSFFQRFGKEIKELSVTMKCKHELTPENIINFQILLFNLFPKLHYIYFENMSNLFNYEIPFSPCVNLNRLKILELNNSFDHVKILLWILNEAPNITEIRNEEGRFNRGVLNLLIKMSKVNLIREMRLDFSGKGAESTNLLQTLCNQNLQLEKILEIKFDEEMLIRFIHQKTDFQQQVIEILNRILKSSAQTLKSLNSNTPLGPLFRLLIFPPFPNVTNLSLTYYKSSFTLFPKLEANNFKESFPKLKIFKLNFTGDVFTLEPNQVFGNNIEPFLSVTEVQFSNDYIVPNISTEWFLFLREIFPNVRVLKLPKLRASNLMGVLSKFWKNTFLNLTELKVTIYVDSVDTSLEIDAGFTGFSKKTCENLLDPLWGADIRFIGCTNIDALRINPSILDIESLRKLEIELVCPMMRPPPSGISKRFAFDLCPFLEVSTVINKQR